MQTSLQKRAWYLDRFGMERECVVITMSGLGAAGVLAVMGLDGQPVEVDAKDVYYVPQGAEEGETP